MRACVVAMTDGYGDAGHDYARQDDGSAQIDERRVNELIAQVRATFFLPLVLPYTPVIFINFTYHALRATIKTLQNTVQTDVRAAAYAVQDEPRLRHRRPAP